MFNCSHLGCFRTQTVRKGKAKTVSTPDTTDIFIDLCKLRHKVLVKFIAHRKLTEIVVFFNHRNKEQPQHLFTQFLHNYYTS